MCARSCQIAIMVTVLALRVGGVTVSNGGPTAGRRAFGRSRNQIEVTDQTDAASQWFLGIAGPTSLVAGAAAASLYETLNSREGMPLSSDKFWVRKVKLCVVSLLASSFAMSIVVTLCATGASLFVSGRSVARSASEALRVLVAGGDALA